MVPLTNGPPSRPGCRLICAGMRPACACDSSAAVCELFWLDSWAEGSRVLWVLCLNRERQLGCTLADALGVVPRTTRLLQGCRGSCRAAEGGVRPMPRL